MPRIAYYAPLFLAALVALLPASLAHAWSASESPAWRAEKATAGYPLDPTTYTATLAGYNEIDPVVTSANGEATVTLDGMMLTVAGTFADLSSAYAASHIHLGGPGENGPVVIPLNANVNADDLGGTFETGANTFDLSTLTYPEGVDADAVVSAIADGDVYVNVHTANFPAGEIRGQVLSTPNQAPTAPALTAPNNEAALALTGAANQDFEVDWEDASDPDDNEVVYVWQLATDADFNNIVFQTNTGTESEFTTDFGTVDALLAGADVDVDVATTLYHRANAQDGSLRTTGGSRTVVLTRGGVQYDLETNLAGFNEVEPVKTSASGSATATLVNNVLTLSGSFADLSSAYSASHIHLGGPGENGPVVIPLNANVGSDNVSGTFEATANTFDLATQSYPEGIDLNAVRSGLINGGTYVNVHTANFPAGEIRGQLLATDNAAPEEVSIESPEDEATVTIEGAGSTDFTADWEDAEDSDDNRVVYVWQLASDEDFDNILFQTNTGTESEFTTDFNTVAALLEAAGVAAGGQVTLYHRANAQDGSLRTEGESASVTLVRSSDPLPVDEEAGLPERFTLGGNYPNPFNPSTSVRFDLPHAAQVSLKVYDLVGREVMALPAQAFGAGARQEIRVDAAALSSGTYLYRVIAQTGTETETRTGAMVLIK